MTPNQAKFLRRRPDLVAKILGPTTDYIISTKDVAQIPLPRSFPEAKRCLHNQGENGTTKVGCARCTTYACGVKGTVKISDCANCESYAKPIEAT